MVLGSFLREKIRTARIQTRGTLACQVVPSPAVPTMPPPSILPISREKVKFLCDAISLQLDWLSKKKIKSLGSAQCCNRLFICLPVLASHTDAGKCLGCSTSHPASCLRSRKAAEDGQSPWDPAPTLEAQMKLMVPDRLSSGHCSHVRNEPVDKKNLSLSLKNSAFQTEVNKSLKGGRVLHIVGWKAREHRHMENSVKSPPKNKEPPHVFSMWECIQGKLNLFIEGTHVLQMFITALITLSKKSKPMCPSADDRIRQCGKCAWWNNAEP